MSQSAKNLTWTVKYKKSVKKDFKKLSPESKRLIRKAIEERLAIDPLRFGIPLRGTLKKYFKYRVGDYRIVYKIVNDEVVILVMKIGHRKDVYDKISE